MKIKRKLKKIMNLAGSWRTLCGTQNLWNCDNIWWRIICMDLKLHKLRKPWNLWFWWKFQKLARAVVNYSIWRNREIKIVIKNSKMMILILKKMKNHISTENYIKFKFEMIKWRFFMETPYIKKIVFVNLMKMSRIEENTNLWILYANCINWWNYR